MPIPLRLPLPSRKNEEEILEEEDMCAICHDKLVNGILMDCPSTHSFCFNCICEQIESSTRLNKCALCRGGTGGIIIIKKYIKNYTTNADDTKYPLNLLRKYYPTILVKCFPNNKFVESSYIPRRILKAFVTNINNINKIEKLYSEVGSTEFLKLYEEINWANTNDLNRNTLTFENSFGDFLAQSFTPVGNNTHSVRETNNTDEPLTLRSVAPVSQSPIRAHIPDPNERY